ELMAMLEELGDSADVQERGQYISGKARLELAQGRPADALATAELTIAEASLGISSEVVKEALVAGLEASLELGDLAKTRELLRIVDELPPGRSPQSLQAQSARFRAQLAIRDGDQGETERLFKQAAQRLRELSFAFYLAVTQLEHAEWLVREGRVTDAELPLA